MITLASTDDLLAALHRARSVTMAAYILRPGRVVAELERAAARGATVHVRLEAQPYGDTSGDLKRTNQQTIAALRRSGADAILVDSDGEHPLHMKVACIDGSAFLDDRNWPDDGMDTIVRDTDPRDVDAASRAILSATQDDAPLATRKDAAQRREARTIYHAADTGAPIDVQSESFGFGRIYAALVTAARAGARVRLLVAQRDVSARSEAALQRLAAQGVQIRISGSDEKMAVTTGQAWIGSANASGGARDQIDWGLRVFEAPVVAQLQHRYERNWESAQPYVATGR